MTDYYILIEEWNYPNESGTNGIVGNVCSSLDEACDTARSLAETEVPNFESSTGEDALPPQQYREPWTDESTGYIVTAQSGLSDYYYAIRIEHIVPLLHTVSMLLTDTDAKKAQNVYLPPKSPDAEKPSHQ